MPRATLSWSPGRAIVVDLPPAWVPRYALPPEATPIHHDGQPAWHVTLIRRATLAPIVPALEVCWPTIAGRVSAPPRPLLDRVLRRGHDARKGSVGWFVDVVNADAYRAYVREVTDAIDATLRATGRGAFVNDDTSRHFHVTIANDQGGDPLRSPSAPHLP